MNEVRACTKQIRGPRLVKKVLASTLCELAESGYHKLSFERVAERAQVNKVTLYRRWPTKETLVRAALLQLAEEQPSDIDTGELRGDILAYLRGLCALMSTPMRRTLVGLAMQPEGEVRDLAMDIWREREPLFNDMFLRAMQRGEVPSTFNGSLLQSLFHGTIMVLILFKQTPCDDAQLSYIADVALHGALRACGAVVSVPRQSA